MDNTIYHVEIARFTFSTKEKPYSTYHLKACFDLLVCTYSGLIIQREIKLYVVNDLIDTEEKTILEQIHQIHKKLN